jgi:hypothetical protein
VHHAACGAGGLHKVDGDGKGGDSTPKGGVGGRVVLCPQGTVRVLSRRLAVHPRVVMGFGAKVVTHKSSL